MQRSSPTESGPQSYLSGDSPGWGHPATPLPPSPPLTRTPISRVKERAKTQVSRSRVYNKRSRSSPPSSRRNTLDTIRVPPVRFFFCFLKKRFFVSRYLFFFLNILNSLQRTLFRRTPTYRKTVRLEVHSRTCLIRMTRGNFSGQ